jgi:nicotinic acid mononucleotide adenylyltransferase
MIIGMDNANTFDKWVNYEYLKDMMRFVVVSRQGVERDPGPDWYLFRPHIFIQAEHEIPEISSTQVRELFLGLCDPGKDVDRKAAQGVCQDVWDYILKEGLYMPCD